MADASANDDELLFVKLCFQSDSSSQRGAALIRLRAGSRKIEKIDALSGQSGDFVGNLSSMSPAAAFIDFLTQKRFSGEYHKKASAEVVSALTQAVEGNTALESGNVTSDIVNFARKNNAQGVLHSLQPFLQRALYDKKVEIDLGLEFATQNELDHYFKNQGPGTPPQETVVHAPADEFFNIGSEKILLDCHPVLAPVGGVSMHLLRQGMDVMVRIDGTNPLGSKYNTLFGLVSDDGKILARRATVEAAETVPGANKALLLFQGNIYGRIVETEPIKIKLFEADAAPDPDRVPTGSKLVTWALVAGAVLLLAVLFIVFTFL